MRPTASQPFVKNDEEMLWLGLLSRDTGIPASQRLNIKDEVLALDFDLAVTLRLLRYDNEKDAENKKFLARVVLGNDAVKDDDDDSVLDSNVLSSDPFADKYTQVW